MNIFILHFNPVIAARHYCDKHSPKMCVELLQQLGSAVIRHGATPDMMPLTKKGTPLKGGYHHHPCTVWCGDSRANFEWQNQWHKSQPVTLPTKTSILIKFHMPTPQHDAPRINSGMAFPHQCPSADVRKILCWKHV